MDLSKLRRPLLWFGGLVFTTAALPQLFGAVTAYGNSSRDAATLARTLADEAVTSVSGQVNAIAVLVYGLTPGSQLVSRCEDATLPAAVDAAQVCADAARDEIVEEQQESLALRRSQLDAVALAGRLEYTLEDRSAALAFATLVDAVRLVRALETSDLCNEEREETVDALASPAHPPAVSREWATEVRAGLVGPRTAQTRCDLHGDAFIPAMRVAMDSLQREAGVVSRQISRSRVAGLDDRPRDLARSTFNLPAVAALVVAAAAFSLGSAIRPARTSEPDVVD